MREMGVGGTKAHYGATILDLIKAGILNPGDEATLEPRRGEMYRGRVEANGNLTLDGRPFDSPSQAATTLAGNSRNGWKEVKVKGRPLTEYRDQFIGGRRPRAPSPSVAQTQPPPAAPLAQPPPAPSHTPSISLADLVAVHIRELTQALAGRTASTSAEQFEELVAEFLRRLGYSDVRRVGGPGDRNIDVTGSYPAPFMRVAIRVQVKHRRSGPNIGPSDVAAFRDRAGGADHSLIMVTNVEFTDGAKETASEQGRQLVHLVDGKELINTMIDKKIGVKEGPMAVLEVDETFWRRV